MKLEPIKLNLVGADKLREAIKLVSISLENLKDAQSKFAEAVNAVEKIELSFQLDKTQ